MTRKELKTLRTQRGLTQAALAALVGVHWSTVARWEQGVRVMPESMARFVVLVLKAGTKRKKGKR
jgi:DNA-binding transcriptional regulator YiaG